MHRSSKRNPNQIKFSVAASLLAATYLSAIGSVAMSAEFDIILRGGTIYNGSGERPFVGDVAIRGDRIVGVGNLGDATAEREIDVQGKAVAPGFINMLSWATTAFLADGRAQSDIRQGVTLEVFGEGWSMGPLNERMKRSSLASQRFGSIDSVCAWLRCPADQSTMVDRCPRICNSPASDALPSLPQRRPCRDT